MNLPDDWGYYYRTCHDCGQTYHASGVVECGCERCLSCGELAPVGEELNTDGVCSRCLPEEEEEEEP